MNQRERGILIGLAIVLAAGTAFMVWQASSSGNGGDAPAAPAGWDLSRIRDIGEPIRQFTTPGGVIVQVMTEGHGDPVAPGQAMDIHYTGHDPVTGGMIQRHVRHRLILEEGGVIPGWIEGLQGVRRREKRRLLIPAAMAYGAHPPQRSNIQPNADLVFDVEWVELETQDTKEGTGKQAQRGSRVLVHYRGTLPNGKVFDSSYKRGEPLWLTLKTGPGGVIDGWVHGIAGMKVGGVRKLWIPWHLAYGAQGRQGIPGYSDLSFVVELLGVE